MTRLVTPVLGEKVTLQMAEEAKIIATDGLQTVKQTPHNHQLSTVQVEQQALLKATY